MPKEPEPLELVGTIGFSGHCLSSYKALPDGVHILYVLGGNLVLKNLHTKKQLFLSQHDDAISCVCVSKDGLRAATGVAPGLAEAEIVVWDLDAAKENLANDGDAKVVVATLVHDVSVQALAFSPNGRYMASLGGPGDNMIMLWKLSADGRKYRMIENVIAGSDQQLDIQFCNNDENNLVFVTCGRMEARVWSVGEDGKLGYKVIGTGNVKRVFTSIAIDSNDKYAALGSKTGDLLKVDLMIGKTSPPLVKMFSKGLYQNGVSHILLVDDSELFVGCGNGLLSCIDFKTMGHQCAKNEVELSGRVTSVSAGSKDGVRGYWVGTSQANVYFITPVNDRRGGLKQELVSTGHVKHVNNTTFFYGNATTPSSSEFFVTCGKSDVRLWRMPGGPELLRIQVPNLECNCVVVSPTGDVVVTGWDDGKIRGFSPESGKLLFVQSDAHTLGGVNSLAMNDDADSTKPQYVVSGGSDGRVRVWSLSFVSAERIICRMVASHKDHTSKVNCITMAPDNTTCVSASDDGCCIVWDMTSPNFSRKNAMMASTNFYGACYHPDQSQLLTCGSDKKLTYWDAEDNSCKIREIPSFGGTPKSIDILSGDGEIFVASISNEVSVYSYDEGIQTHIGKGHSGIIKNIKISPCKKFVISVCDQGGIFVWRLPRM